MYTRGTVVQYNGFSYTIDHNMISKGELYVYLQDLPTRVLAREVVVPATTFTIHDCN